MSHNYDHKDKVDRARAHVHDAKRLIIDVIAHTPSTAQKKRKLLSQAYQSISQVEFANLSYYYIPPKEGKCIPK